MPDYTSGTVLDREPAVIRPTIRPVRASAARSAAGRPPAKKTNGLATAATNGTRSTREGRAQPAYNGGLRLSASLAVDGRRIRLGMLTGNLQFPPAL